MMCFCRAPENEPVVLMAPQEVTKWPGFYLLYSFNMCIICARSAVVAWFSKVYYDGSWEN